MTGRENAKRSGSFSAKGIVKKQSFRLITKSGQSFGLQAGLGTPGSREPIGWRDSLIFLRSWISLHLPDFFGRIKIGVFQGLLEGSIWPASNCCLTKRQFYSSCSPLGGHWSTHTGVSESQVSGRGVMRAVTTRENEADRFAFLIDWGDHGPKY